MAHTDPTIQKVLDAVQDKPEAVKALSKALLTRDAAQLREAIAATGVALSEAEVSRVLASMPRDDQQALAYFT